MARPRITTHPMYYHWSGLRRRCSIDPKWKHFDEFLTSVTPSPDTGEPMVLMPKNMLASAGPDNYMWITKYDHRRLYCHARWIWYKGILLRQTDWAYIFGVSSTHIGRLVAHAEEHCIWQDKLFDSLLRNHTTPEEKAALKERIAECVRTSSPGEGVIVRTANAAPGEPSSWIIEPPPPAPAPLPTPPAPTPEEDDWADAPTATDPDLMPEPEPLHPQYVPPTPPTPEETAEARNALFAEWEDAGPAMSYEEWAASINLPA